MRILQPLFSGLFIIVNFFSPLQAQVEVAIEAAPTTSQNQALDSTLHMEFWEISFPRHLKYKDTHQLPVNKTMLLERFLFNKVEGYTRSDGKSGSIIRLLMNNEVYEVKV